MQIVRTLVAAAWLYNDALLSGSPGSGNSQLANITALAWVVREWRVLMTRTHDPVQRLQTARRELGLEAAIAKLDRYHLLILDGLAYASSFTGSEHQARDRCSRRDNSRIVRLVLCVVFLGACSGDAATSRFELYGTRLARSLKVDAAEDPEPVSPARRPRKRDMLLDREITHISILDFLQLYDCALGEVIGERNSILGKVAPASRRLFNDLAFLHVAPACITQLQAREKNELADQLVEAVGIRRDGLASSIANATIVSDEFSGLWRVPVALDVFPADSGSEIITELQYIESEVSRWLSGDYEHDAVRFENALGTLRHGWAGSLIAAAVLTRSQLESVTRTAQSRREGRPLCFKQTPSAQGRILRRVVDLFFVGEIQVWLARVNALRHDLLAPHLLLEQHLHAAQSPAYRQWRELRDAQLASLSSAPREHVDAILPILTSCGLAPGARNSEGER